MRILFISSFLLFSETRSGAAKRLFYLARFLAEHHEVSLICLDAGNEAESYDPARGPCERVLQVEYSRGLGAKFGNPFEVPNYLSLDAVAKINAFVGVQSADVVLCAFGFALSLLRLSSLHSARKIAYLEDDLSFEVFKERARKANTITRKAHMWLRWAQAETFYRQLLRRVQQFIVISAEEASIVEQKFPWLKTTLVGYGIPLEEFPWLEAKPIELTFGFIGNYIHQSNSDAVQYFLNEWFPALRRRFPALKVHIAGKGIPKDLRLQSNGDSAIVWQENVENLRDFYAGISIFINPIVSQRGLRTKLVEAGAFGRPIISTPLGAEGLEHLGAMLATTANECVKAAETLALRQDYDAAARRGRDAVERYYSIEAIAGILRQSLEALHQQ